MCHSSRPCSAECIVLGDVVLRVILQGLALPSVIGDVVLRVILLGVLFYVILICVILIGVVCQVLFARCCSTECHSVLLKEIMS